MHVLVTNRGARSQLSLLLHDLGCPPVFHSDVDELIARIRLDESSTMVLIQKHEGLAVGRLSELKALRPSLNLIGFELLDDASSSSGQSQLNVLTASFVLPAHPQRARTVLQATIRQYNSGARLNSSPSLKQFRAASAMKRPMGRLQDKLSSVHRPRGEALKALRVRYVVCESPVMRSFVGSFGQISWGRSVCILQGEPDAEFELVAREINFQENSDQVPLRFIQNDEVQIDILEKMEREAKRSNVVMNCYVGRTDELDAEQVKELLLFAEYLRNIRTPHLRMILAHEIMGDGLLREGAEADVLKLLKTSSRVEIPRFNARTLDIREICFSVISSLRTAHPFLMVHSISNEAIDYLIEQRGDLSFGKIARMLRNAVGLAQHSVLEIDDLRNYGESDDSIQHLLESMADEKYFPTAENF